MNPIYFVWFAKKYYVHIMSESNDLRYQIARGIGQIRQFLKTCEKVQK